MKIKTKSLLRNKIIRVFLIYVRYVRRDQNRTSAVTKITENKYWNISQILLGFTKIPLIWESPVQFGIFLYENCKTFCLAKVQILFNILFYVKKSCITRKLNKILAIFYMGLFENAGHLSSTTTGKCAQESCKGQYITCNDKLLDKVSIW